MLSFLVFFVAFAQVKTPVRRAQLCYRQLSRGIAPLEECREHIEAEVFGFRAEKKCLIAIDSGRDTLACNIIDPHSFIGAMVRLLQRDERGPR